MTGSRRSRTIAIALLALGLLLCAWVPAASGSSAHDFLYTVPASEVPGATYYAEGIAVDNSSGPSAGDLYLGSRNPLAIDKFDPSSTTATYLCQITGKGESSTSASECDKAEPGVGGFQSVRAVAVDPSSGLVYLADPTAHRVYQFTQAGLYTGRSLNLGAAVAERLDVSAATGDVFVADKTNNRIIEWNPATETSSTFASQAGSPLAPFGLVAGVAVDNDPASPSYQDVYVVDARKQVIDKLSETGAYLCQITGAGSASTSASECDKSEPGLPTGKFTALTGAVTVDPSNGHLYAGEDLNFQACPPECGRLDEFSAAGIYFDSIFGTELPKGFWSPAAASISAASGDIFVASDLNPKEAYVFGPDKPLATTRRATAVTPGSAVLQGTVNPLGIALTGCRFEYVEAARWEPHAAEPYAAGASVPCEGALPGGEAPAQVEAQVSGLTAGAPYHFRLVAENANGASKGEDESFGPPVVIPKAVTEIGQTAATLNAAVDPDSLETTYLFEYGDPGGSAGSYPHSLPASPGTLAAGSAEATISQQLTGLQLGASYHYRISATNSAGTTYSEDRSFSTLPAALIDPQPAASIGTTEATLQAYVDPLGAATSYRFEYGTSTAYGQSTETAAAGEGSSPTLQSARISGLQPGTLYHFRLIAGNPNGTVEGADTTFTTEPASCPNEAFRTGPSAALPECRAFEQVSPEQKGGAPAALPRVGTDGNRILYLGFGSFAGNTYGGGPINGSEYLAQRGPDGWVSEAIHPSESATAMYLGGRRLTVSPDLTESLWEGSFGSIFSRPTSGGLVRRNLDGSIDPASPTLTPLEPGIPWEGFVPPNGHTLPRFPAESADLSHVLLVTNIPLLPDQLSTHVDQPGFYNRLYDITTAPSPGIALVNVDDAGNAIECHELQPITDYNLTTSTAAFNEISRDGSTIFFSCAPEKSGGRGAAVIYARIAQRHTVRISEPTFNDDCLTAACAAAPLDSGAAFAGASEDGRKAFFLSARRLTDEASEDPAERDSATFTVDRCALPKEGPNGCNLYMYGFGRPVGQSLLTVSAGDASGAGPQVQAVVRESEDGSRLYFVARGLLTGQPNALGQRARAGADNLYLYDTAAERVSFVGQLCSGEERSGTLTGVSTCFGNDQQMLWDENHSFANRDGSVFLFTTYSQLTPDDTNQTTDVYRFDARTGALARVSVGHNGADQNGNGGAGATLILNEERHTTGNAQLERQAGMTTRPMSEDGSTVVFVTSRPLQEGDENQEPDAYEWHEGEVTLVSGGTSTVGVSNQGDAIEAENVVLSPGGRDIVFSTDVGLVAGDGDGLNDLYDARLDGGSPPAQVPPSPCEGSETCAEGATTPPPAPALGSQQLRGSGNQPQCHKGYALRHGRCVKKHHKRRHRTKRHKHRHHHSKRHPTAGGKRSAL